jgi:hypothetical protein
MKVNGKTTSREGDEDHPCRRRTGRLERLSAAQRTFAIRSAWPQSSSRDVTEPTDVSHAIAAVRRGQSREGDLDAGGPELGVGRCWGSSSVALCGLRCAVDGDGAAVWILEHEGLAVGVLNGSVRIGTPWGLSRSCSAWASSACGEPETSSPGGLASRSVRTAARGQEQDRVGLERRHARRYARHGLEAEFMPVDPAERCRSWACRARTSWPDKWDIAITRLARACGPVVQVGDPVSLDDLGLSSSATGIDSGRGRDVAASGQLTAGPGRWCRRAGRWLAAAPRGRRRRPGWWGWPGRR